MTVEDNTNSILAALSGIADAITAGFAEVMAALGAIQTGVDAIDSEVGTVHSEVDAIHGEVDAIHGEVEAIGDAVAGVEDKVDAVNSAITAAAAALGPDPRIATIAEGVTANSVTINNLAEQLADVTEMLEMISEEVGVVQETVATSADGTTTALSELHSVEVEYGVPVSAFGNNKATDTVYKADLKLACESPVFIDRVDTEFTDTAPTASDDVGVFAPHTTLATNKVSVIADGMTVYNTQFEAGGDPILYRNGASFSLAELATGSSLTIKLSTDRTTAIIETGTADNVNKSFSIQRYLQTSTRDRILTDTTGAAVTTGTVPAGGTNLTKANAGKVTVLDLTIDLYSSAEDPKCTVTPPAGPSVDYAQTDQEVSFAISAAEGEDRSIKTINDATFSCSGATAITKVSLEGGLIADFRTFVDLTLSAGTDKTLSFVKVGDALEASFEEPFEITSGEVTLAGQIPGSAALVSVTYDTVADAKCSPPS